uniref:Uncharacterized protein n=1 Tax=Meloidogyne enterolobii TaxID=390850 RepID=A0A6V7XSM6_MELEN|nr:unnamed protein product [Meloidogyne enterolobii]
MSSNSSSASRKRKKSPITQVRPITNQLHQNIPQQQQQQQIQSPNFRGYTIPKVTNANVPQQQQQLSPQETEALQAKQALADEIAEKRRLRETTRPANLHLLTLIDPITNLTSTDVLMLAWKKNDIFEELKGLVVFVKRALTTKNKYDRGDLVVEVGQTHEKERISIFGWNEQASKLETANINDIVVLKNLIVVPEDNERVNWAGSIDFKLKFSKSSTLTIVEQGQIAASQQTTNMIEEGPSTSAANQNPHVGNVQNSSYASNTTAAIDRDVEYDFEDL